MPRQARLDVPGVLYHIIARGIERKELFKGEDDFKQFIIYLSENIKATKNQCYAWVLMSNHFHLLVQRTGEPISRMMASLLTRYAQWFNRKHRRAGYLFQNRYKSIICDSDNYLTELIAYIHLNPYRAGIIKNVMLLDRYPWSGHTILMGKKGIDWYNKEEVLGLFGRTSRESRYAYVEYIKERACLKEDLSGGGLIRSGGGLREVMGRKKDERETYDERILGDGSFVDAVLDEYDRKNDEKEKVKKNWDINRLIKETVKAYNIDFNDLSKREKSTSRIMKSRARIAYFGAKYLDLSMTEIGRKLNISQSAISKLYKRGEGILEGDDFLAKLLIAEE